MVWVPMLPGDSRARWDADTMRDARVVHLWDPERVSGLYLAEHAREMGIRTSVDIVWDMFLVFDAAERWNRSPPTPVASGATVIGRSEELRRALVPLLERS
jgi:hypothetical protein